MNMEFLNEFFVPVIAAICVCVGYIIKTATPIANRLIPVINAILGLMLAVWMNWDNITPQVILSGVFSGLASTGMYEAFRNTIGDGK